MSRSILTRAALVATCSMAVLVTTVGQTIAATKKATERVPVAATKHNKEQFEQRKNLPIERAQKNRVPTVVEGKPDGIQKPVPAVRTEPKATNSKRHRRMKVHKKGVPKVVVQPRTDLMYHGILESSQRYDPRRNLFGSGIPYPHTPELTHDRFQELDRNKDGKIDPVERTFGRLDMDRDLHDRRPR